MPKKWKPAWTASLSVAIPISADNPATVIAAKAAVEELLAALPSGATLEITRAGFGRMEIPGSAQPEATKAENGAGLSTERLVPRQA